MFNGKGKGKEEREEKGQEERRVASLAQTETAVFLTPFFSVQDEKR